MAWHGSARRGMAGLGMEQGMVWRGLARQGVAWLGEAGRGTRNKF